MAMFLAVLRRSGPQWDPSRSLEEQSDWPAHASFMDGLVDAVFVVLGGPLADEHRVVHAVEAESEDAVRVTFARDPWVAPSPRGFTNARKLARGSNRHNKPKSPVV